MLGKKLIALIVAGSLVPALVGCRGLRGPGSDCTPRKTVRLPLHRFGSDTATLTPPVPDSSGYFGESAGPLSPAADDETDPDALRQSREDALARLKTQGARLSQSDEGELLGVDLARTDAGDGDLADLALFPELHEVNLRDTDVTDEGLEHLAPLEELEFLGLTGTRVTDDGLAHLAQLTSLRFLTLGNTEITDDGLEGLARCTRLEAVNLKATRVSPAGVAQLRSRLPLCRIITDSVTAAETETSLDGESGPRPNGFDAHLPFDAPFVRPKGESDPFDIPLPPRPRPRIDVDEPLSPLQPLPDASSDEPFVDEPIPALSMIAREVHWPAVPAVPALQRPVLRVAPIAPIPSPALSTAGDPQQRLMLLLREKLEDPDVLHAIAQVYAQHGNWRDARNMLRAALELAPEDALLRYELAVAKARCGDFDAAYSDFEQTVGPARAHYNLGVLLHESGQPIAAVGEFREALRRDESLTPAREWLAFVQSADRPAAAEDDRFVLSEEQIRKLFLHPPRAAADDLQQASYGVEIRPRVSSQHETASAR